LCGVEPEPPLFFWSDYANGAFRIGASLSFGSGRL
jgi:hypothetical protein